jgi:hypothetical protein
MEVDLFTGSSGSYCKVQASEPLLANIARSSGLGAGIGQ